MASFLTITLVVSASGLILMLALKCYEMRRGRLILASVRPKVGGAAHNAVMFIESVLPALFLRGARGLVAGARGLARRIVARSIVLFERLLHKMLVFMHDMTRPPQAGGPASAFLQEVAEHKRALQKRAPGKRMILDDN
ncbi:MAG TPA: hypothetical protein VHD55_02775 [Candidatus Paceibacterota bacterium]|nr:hypothetical protein [Candidatus Paceibacterota bacterium]